MNDPAERSTSMILARTGLAFLSLFIGACASPALDRSQAPVTPSYAAPPATEGVLADTTSRFRATAEERESGFKLLDTSEDGLKWRLALIDSAVSSLDIQTYLWYPDDSGRLVLERAVRAARRGVRVRLIVDDLLTMGQDQLLADLQAQPNIEVRLFNPWENRGPLARAGEMIAELERLNTRMHNKLQIADGVAAIVGGRNIGDHYFGLSDAYNFHDLDLLGFGPIAEQAGEMFDHFWNSEWVASAAALTTEPTEDSAREAAERIMAMNRETDRLSAFPVEPIDWTADLQALVPELHSGVSRLLYDTAAGETIDQNMIGRMFQFFRGAERELLITNAYIIPGQPAIDMLQALNDRGVSVRILTNSLSSHDVPAVNSHYEPWRDDIINAGAELYELRADAAIDDLVSVPPAQGEFVGLHTKAAVADRERVFIGSMNLDPRSANINTEGGAFVRSRGLAAELAAVMLRDMQPENAWQVLLNEEGAPYWISGDERLDQQPARSGTQRIMNVIFKIFPEEQY